MTSNFRHFRTNAALIGLTPLSFTLFAFFTFAITQSELLVAQSTIPFGGIKADFGIDLDVHANRLQDYNGTAPGTDDWFSVAAHPGTGVGVIDTTGAYSLFQFYNNAANINQPFSRRMRYKFYARVNEKRQIDGLFLRDNFGGTNSAGNFPDSTVYVIASKNGAAPSLWRPGVGNVGGKNDILDIYGHLRRKGPGIYDSLYLFTGVSLNTTSGARYVDFEFFQSPVTYSKTPSPYFTDGGAQEEGHTAFLFNSTGKFIRAGDLIFAVELGSAGVQTFDVRIWMSRALYNTYRTNPPANRSVDFGPNFDGASQNSLYGYAQIRPRGGGQFDAAGILDNYTTTAPPWGATFNGVNSTNYSTQQFAEIALNLTQLGIDPLAINPSADPCTRAFFKYMVKTRASNAFTAQLQDFTAPADFGGPPIVNTTASVTSSVLTCANPSTTITAVVSPALQDYYYKWTFPNGTSQTGLNQTSLTVTTPGTYTVDVLPVEFCSSISTFSITVTQDISTPAAPTGATGAEYCAGSSIPSISVTNPGSGFLTRWYSASTGGSLLGTGSTFQPSSPGTYYAETYKLSNGCVSPRVPVVLSQLALPVVSTSSTIPCQGLVNGSASVSASSGTPTYTYSWNTGSTTSSITGIGSGIYSVTVTDSKGCKANTSVEVGAAIPILGTLSTIPVTCFGESNGQLTLTASGGNAPLQYNWGGGETGLNYTNLSAGTYIVTITDALGCTKTVSGLVPQPQDLQLSATLDQVACFGATTGNINLNPVGGTQPYTYSWSTNATSQDLFGVGAGTYTVTVTDANNCTKSLSSTITEPALLAVTATPAPVLCHGLASGQIGITPTGGTTPYTYTWSDGRTTEDRSGLAAGTYSVTVTDANQCTTTTSAVVTEPAVALSGSVVATNVNCYLAADGTIDLSVTGGTSGYTYSWTNGLTTQDLNSLPPANYVVTITDANGCTAVQSAQITQPLPLLLNAVVTPATCPDDFDGMIDLTATGGTTPYTYAWAWNGGSNTSNTEDLTGVAPNITYQVLVTDVNGCTAVTTVTVGHTDNFPTTPTSIKNN